ncbi:Golgi membrane protein 1 [Rhynchocyon petersi]
MMGLGNGRRNMKSPPFLLVALVACIIVLGFNYWIASSRSMDLQTRIKELEGRVRRAAAERGAVELKKNEFQGELEKQREQLDKIQLSHNFQLESLNKLHQDEKAVLVNNITTGEKLIRTLQDQLKALHKNYGKLQHDVLQFQKNQTNLEKKFSYDLNQCINQMKEVKEQCEEKIEEVTKKGNEARASRGLNEENDQSQQFQSLRHASAQGAGSPSSSGQPQPREQAAGPLKPEMPQGEGNTLSSTERQNSPEAPLDLKRPEETNEIQIASEEEAQRVSMGLPQEPGQEQATKDNTLIEGRGVVDARELGQTPQVPAVLLVSQENNEPEDPEQDQLIVSEGQDDKEQGADEQGRNKQKVGGDDYYNMDENEAEPEGDKQMELVGKDKSLDACDSSNG